MSRGAKGGRLQECDEMGSPSGARSAWQSAKALEGEPGSSALELTGDSDGGGFPVSESASAPGPRVGTSGEQKREAPHTSSRRARGKESMKKRFMKLD